jgi:MFS family permease
MEPLSIVTEQIRRVRSFSPVTHRLFLFALFVGLGRAVWNLVFNLYLKQAGYHEDFIGDLNFVAAMASAVAAPLAGLLSNRLGRRTMLLAGATLEMLALLISVWVSQRGALLTSMLLSGVAFPMWIVPLNPFLAEHSTLDERVPLFSTMNIIWLGTAMVGSVAGGWLPGLLSALGLAPGPDNAVAYRLAATAGALLYLPALGCLLALKPGADGREGFPVQLALRPFPAGLLGMLAAFMTVTVLLGLGFGVYFPFINLYFKEYLDASPGTVGLIMGAAQAAGCVGLLLAPTLARRLGKVRAVTLAQVASIPFILGMGLAGSLWAGVAAYLGRFAVWNLGSSSFDAFQMEAVPDRLRAFLNSLAGLPSGVGFNLAWALGGALGGRLIVGHGYPAIFIAAVAFTLPGTIFYFFRFRHMSAPAQALPNR